MQPRYRNLSRFAETLNLIRLNNFYYKCLLNPKMECQYKMGDFPLDFMYICASLDQERQSSMGLVMAG